MRVWVYKRFLFGPFTASTSQIQRSLKNSTHNHQRFIFQHITRYYHSCCEHVFNQLSHNWLCCIRIHFSLHFPNSMEKKRKCFIWSSSCLKFQTQLFRNKLDFWTEKHHIHAHTQHLHEHVWFIHVPEQKWSWCESHRNKVFQSHQKSLRENDTLPWIAETIAETKKNQTERKREKE